jgi:hypothetical protein
MGVLFMLLNWHMLSRRPDELGVTLDDGTRRRLLVWNLVGLGPYALATALAPVSAYATLVITAAVAGFYALPFARASEPD